MSEIIRLGNQLALPAAIGERALSDQLPNRLVIFGRQFDGGGYLARELQDLVEQEGRSDISVDFTQSAPHAARLFFGLTPANTEGIPSIPKGVIAFPEMRIVDVMSMTVPTPIEDIREACAYYNVPLLEVSAHDLAAGEALRRLPEITA